MTTLSVSVVPCVDTTRTCNFKLIYFDLINAGINLNIVSFSECKNVLYVHKNIQEVCHLDLQHEI